MSRLVAFFSWIGVIFFTGLVIGTLMTWSDGSYQGSLGQWILQQVIQGALLGLSVWGAVRSWRKRQALPPAERSRLGIGCLALIGVVAIVIIGFAIVGIATNRKAERETKAVAPPVIAALERFKADKKEYPKALEQLVPQYLPAIPRCGPGDPRPRMAYYYDTNAGDYELACPAFMFMRYRYRSATRGWDLYD